MYCLRNWKKPSKFCEHQLKLNMGVYISTCIPLTLNYFYMNCFGRNLLQQQKFVGLLPDSVRLLIVEKILYLSGSHTCSCSFIYCKNIFMRILSLEKSRHNNARCHCRQKLRDESSIPYLYPPPGNRSYGAR